MKPFHCYFQPMLEEGDLVLVDVPPKVVVRHHFEFVLVLGHVEYSWELLGDSLHLI